MIILTIGEVSRRLADPAALEESWVTLHMRKAATAESVTPGVHVRIAAPSIALNLSAGEPLRGDAFARRLTPSESCLITLWQERGLHRPDFRGGQLVAFLHQLYDVLEQGDAAPARTGAMARSAGAGLQRSGVPA